MLDHAEHAGGLQAVENGAAERRYLHRFRSEGPVADNVGRTWLTDVEHRQAIDVDAHLVEHERKRPSVVARRAAVLGSDETAARLGHGWVHALFTRPRPAGLAAAVANLTVMDAETRIERRLDRLIARAATPRAAAGVIATVTTTITIGAGFLMTVVDGKGFPSIGSGLWWAVQTVTTVGYGDHVPETAAGQILAVFVMLLGIGFITVITASITGAFVARTRKEQVSGDPTHSTQQLQDIIARLERIEVNLNQRT
jgi:voltage-gated potassium channel